jgi:PAS domain S-box-containing protein
MRPDRSLLADLCARAPLRVTRGVPAALALVTAGAVALVTFCKGSVPLDPILDEPGRAETLARLGFAGVASRTALTDTARERWVRWGFCAAYVFLTCWIAWLCWAADFALPYPAGLVMAVVVLSVNAGTFASTRALLAVCFAAPVIAGLTALALTPDPHVPITFFAPGMIATAAYGYLAACRRQDNEASLRAEREQARAVFHGASDGVAVISVDTLRFLEVNEAYAKLAGSTPDQLVGEHLNRVVAVQPGEPSLQENAGHALDGGAHFVGLRHYRQPDGSLLPVEVNASVVARPGGRVFILVVRDAAQRVAAENQLRHAKEHAERARSEAEEAARFKDAMLHNMSHEIRTPLTGILGFAEILADEVQGEHREFAATMHSAAQRLRRTLDSVLDLAQLEAGTLSVHCRPRRLAEVVRPAIDGLTPLAQRKALHLDLDLDESVWVSADTAAVERIVNNLVGNALKFTDAGRVAVSVFADGEEAVLDVSDTGLGIDPEFQPMLFEAFRQASSGIARRHEGNGLGLAIAHQLVLQMDGRITLESAPNEGTTFQVRLPLLPAETEGDGAFMPVDLAHRPAPGLSA